MLYRRRTLCKCSCFCSVRKDDAADNGQNDENSDQYPGREDESLAAFSCDHPFGQRRVIVKENHVDAPTLQANAGTSAELVAPDLFISNPLNRDILKCC